ncbi:MAG TPA: dephospho-CoA kinase [Candidatus Sulfotelmatobacter sp.]
MLKVGLTGGIAAGKSSVGEMFVALGAHLIQADRIAHDLIQPGQKVYEEVIAHFGEEILNPDHSVNRSKLAEAAFGRPSRIKELNAIVHPAVIRRQNEWMEEVARTAPDGVALVEAALILEAGAAKDFDRLIVVTCNDDQRAARFAARQNMPVDQARKEVARRMAAQLPDAEKIKAADYVIDNSEAPEHTRAQVYQVWEKLRG